MYNNHLIRINKDQSIFIKDVDEEKETITYRNIGEIFDVRKVECDYYVIGDDEMFNILDNIGKPKTFFPSKWLFTDVNNVLDVIEILIEEGYEIKPPNIEEK